MFAVLSKTNHCVSVLLTFAILLFLSIFTQPARAEISWSGNITPDDPIAWTSETTTYIGETAEGSITVDDGSELLSAYGNLGIYAGSSGEVAVNGAGSAWTNSDSL